MPPARNRRSAAGTATWYVEFAESRDPEVPTSIIEVVPASLDVEHDNLRAALTWALAHEPRAALRLAVALWRYWLARACSQRVAAGWRRCWPPSRNRPSCAPAGCWPSRFSTCAGARASGSSRSVRRQSQFTARSSDRARLALALHADGVLAYMRGDWTRCWQRSEEAREAAPGADEVEASTAFLQAMVLLGRHDLPAARVAFEQARAALAAVRSGRPFFATMTLGWVVEDARIYFEETVLPGPRVSAGQARGYVLCNLAYLARLAGDRDEAQGLLDEAVSIFRALGDRDGESMARSHLGCLHRVRAEFAEGRAALEHSLRIRHEIGDRREIGLTLGNLGMLTAAEGDLATGWRCCGRRWPASARPMTRRDG